MSCTTLPGTERDRAINAAFAEGYRAGMERAARIADPPSWQETETAIDRARKGTRLHIAAAIRAALAGGGR